MQPSPQKQNKRAQPAPAGVVAVCTLVCATVALLALCFTTSLLPTLYLVLLAFAAAGLCALVRWLACDREHKMRQRFGVALAAVLVIAYMTGGTRARTLMPRARRSGGKTAAGGSPRPLRLLFSSSACCGSGSWCRPAWSSGSPGSCRCPGPRS